MRLRAVFQDAEPLTLVAATNHLYDLTTLVWVGYLLENQERLAEPIPMGQVSRPYDVNWAFDAVTGPRVDRIGYDTSLQIELTLTSVAPATGKVTLAGGHVVALFDAYHHAWWPKEGQDARVAARRMILGRVGHLEPGQRPEAMIRGAASAVVDSALDPGGGLTETSRRLAHSAAAARPLVTSTLRAHTTA